MNIGSKSKNAFLLFCNIFFIIITSYILTSGWQSFTNILAYNTNWSSPDTKTDFVTINTIYPILSCRNALAGNKLNFGHSDGFYDLLSSKKFDIKSLNFDLYLSKPSVIDIIFSAENEQPCGIRITNGNKEENFFFTLSESNLFIRKKKISLSGFKENKWNKISIALEKKKMRLYINYVFVADFDVLDHVSTKLLFRGDGSFAFIDNILVSNKNGETVLKENFSNRKKLLPNYALVFLTLFLLNIILLFQKKKRLLKLNRLFLFNATLLFGSIIITYLINHFKETENCNRKFYMKKPEVVAYLDFIDPDNTINRIFKSLRNTKKHKYRIMFLGGSQTFGEGAGSIDDTFVKISEKHISEELETDMIKFINAGICGATAKSIYKIYTDRLINLKPDLVVLNISVNDMINRTDLSEFKDSITNIIHLNRKTGIKTVLSLEPISPYYKDYEFVIRYSKYNNAMKNLADKHSIYLIDLNSFMKNQNERGYLWWDIVHFTTLGHKLAGKYIAEQILLYYKDLIRLKI